MAEEQVDLDDIREVYNKVLRKIFFHIYRKKDNGKIIWKILKKTIAFIGTAAPAVYTCMLARNLWNITNFAQKMINLSIMFNVCSILIRWVIIVGWPERMESLFLEFETFNCNKHRRRRAIDVLYNEYKHINNVDFWASVFFFFNIFSWFIFPVIFNNAVWRLITGHTDVTYAQWLENIPTTLPMVIRSPWIEVRYVLETLNAVYGNTTWLASDMICYAIVNLLQKQLILLGESICRNDEIDYRPEPMKYKLFLEDHNRLIKACRTLEFVLSPILAAQLATTGTLLGGILLILVTGPENADTADMGDYASFYIKFLIYMSIALMELYLFCWLSDITNRAYLFVGESVFNSDWYNELNKESKNCVLTMMVAQKGTKITALKMVNIDLRCFIEVLRLSYSFFTIMKQGIQSD